MVLSGRCFLLPPQTIQRTFEYKLELKCQFGHFSLMVSTIIDCGDSNDEIQALINELPAKIDTYQCPVWVSTTTDVIFDTEILDSHYRVYRRDRETTTSNKSCGGGVLAALKDDIVVTRRPHLETDNEIIWIQIKLKCHSLFHATVYPHLIPKNVQ